MFFQGSERSQRPNHCIYTVWGAGGVQTCFSKVWGVLEPQPIVFVAFGAPRVSKTLVLKGLARLRCPNHCICNAWGGPGGQAIGGNALRENLEDFKTIEKHKVVGGNAPSGKLEKTAN